MSTENNGLRFDIYERVNLPDNVAAIEELEEIELIPRIQVIDQGEVVVLQGQLVLNGIYRGEGFGQEQIALEHWIPVEISLPMNRVRQLDEITVDIDTFHVEPVSERALNITGVLALRGIYLEEQEHHWKQDTEYEQLSFVAQSDTALPSQEDSWRSEEEVVLEENRETWFTASEAEQEANDQHASEWIQFAEPEKLQANEELEANEEQVARHEQLELTEAEETEYFESEGEQYEESAAFHESQYEQQAVQYGEQSELERVEQVYYAEADYSASVEAEEVEQFAWQTTEVQQTQLKTSFGIKDLLSTSLREQAVNELQRLDAERERIEQQLRNEKNQTQPIDWRQILLQADSREQFRKIKMYIVQKNDTLDIIAGKYDINPRELLQHNKLHETAINEGQLLYIP